MPPVPSLPITNPSATGVARPPRWLAIPWLCRLLLALGCAAAVAQPAAGDGTVDSQLTGVRRQLDAARQLLRPDSTADDADLLRLRADAIAAQARSADIAQALAPQLALLDARLAELGAAAPAGTREAPDIAVQRDSLTKGRSTLDAQVKLARLLSLESGQLVAQLLTTRRARFQARLGERTPSILAGRFWNELRDDLPRDAQRLAALRDELAAAVRPAPLAAWLALPLLPAGVGAMLFWLHRRALHWLTTRAPAGRLRRSLRALSVLLLWCGVFSAVAVVLHGLADQGAGLRPETAALLDGFGQLLGFCGFLLGLGNALMCAAHPSWRLPPLPDAVAQSMRALPALLTALVLVSASAERLAGAIDASLSTTVAVNCIVALALGLTLGLALMRAERVWRAELARDGKPRSIGLAAVAAFHWLVLAGAVICLLAGYVAFGSFALKQIVWAAACSARLTCWRR